MKRLKTARGERVWFEIDEIEAAAETALRAAGLFPGLAPHAVDIEALLEVHLAAHVDYGANLPATILGYTLFDSPPRVAINGRLTALALAPGASHGLVGRWRATLAHEAAHIILHADLVKEGFTTPKLTSESLEGADPEAAKGWLEVQANMGMAALLMPRGPFLSGGRSVLESQPVMLPLLTESLQADRLVCILSHRFETSREATRWRLRNLGWLAERDVPAVLR